MSFGQRFKSIDMFGEPIKMTYKGDDSFKTNFGACLTILFWMGIIGIIAM